MIKDLSLLINLNSFECQKLNLRFNLYNASTNNMSLKMSLKFCTILRNRLNINTILSLFKYQNLILTINIYKV